MSIERLPACRMVLTRLLAAFSSSFKQGSTAPSHSLPPLSGDAAASVSHAPWQWHTVHPRTALDGQTTAASDLLGGNTTLSSHVPWLSRAAAKLGSWQQLSPSTLRRPLQPAPGLFSTLSGALSRATLSNGAQLPDIKSHALAHTSRATHQRNHGYAANSDWDKPPAGKGPDDNFDLETLKIPIDEAENKKPIVVAISWMAADHRWVRPLPVPSLLPPTFDIHLCFFS